jgi:Xaa-Pro aminopeptidase
VKNFINLSGLRAILKTNNTDAYILPSTDPHLGEYVPDHWRIIQWLTGFAGSSATLVITESFAGLWTDSRYFIQAENQIKGSGFILMKSVQADRMDYTEWLKENLKSECKIGFDGRTIPIGLMRNLEKVLEGKNVSFDINCDIISEIWTDRPSAE